MPLGKRVVGPVKLSRAPIEDEEAKFDLGQVSNNTLVSILRQLGSLSQHAEDLFGELAVDFQKVQERTTRLKGKVETITEGVNALNAKKVKVPVGDLSWYSEQTDHYHAEYGYSSCLFTPRTRPPCVRKAYGAAAQTPVPALRHCNLYRADGKTGSKLFTLSPVVLEDQYVDDPEMEMPPRKHIMAAYFERRPREIPELRPRSLPTLNDLDTFANPRDVTLPTPEQRLLDKSRSHPAHVVSIDVSSFHRQSQYRSSQRSLTGTGAGCTPTKHPPTAPHNTSTASSTSTATDAPADPGGPAPLGSMRRRKRLHSASGGNLVFKEVNSSARAFNQRSASRERWERAQSMNIEHYAPKPLGVRRSRSRERKQRAGGSKDDREDSPVGRSCSLRRSFRSLFKLPHKNGDLWAEGRPRSPGPPVVNLDLPFRRSRSLPRFLRVSQIISPQSHTATWSSRSASTEGRLDTAGEESEDSRENTPARDKPINSRQAERLGRFPSIRRSASSSLSLKLLMSNNADRPSTSAAAASTTNIHSATRAPSSSSYKRRPKSMDISTLRAMTRSGTSPMIPIPVATPITPQDAAARQASTRGAPPPPGQRGVTTTWSSDDVTLRAAGAQDKEERQSSSGNWSGSSTSARYSLDSSGVLSLSLDKDSALSLNMNSSDRSTTDNVDSVEVASTTTGETSTLNGDQSTINGDTSTINGDNSSTSGSYTRPNSTSSRRWGKAASTSSGSTDSSLSNTGLTRRNLRAHDNTQRPFSKNSWRSLDEESSVHSVDQEGFYTSMHNDSGLKRSKIDLIAEEDTLGLTPIEPACLQQQQKSRKKHRRRSASILDNLSNGKRRSKKRSPPPSASTPAISARMMDPKDFPKPPSPGEKKRLVSASSDEGGLCMSSFALPPETKVNSPPPPEEMSFSESDAETIYARVKVKSSISSSTFPSLCFMGSDEEDGDMLGFAQSWRSKDGAVVMSRKSSPSDTKTIPDVPLTTQDDSVVSNVEQGAADTSAYSTWPRSPKTPKSESILKGSGSKGSSNPPRTLNFAPAVIMFDPVTGKNSQGALAATPEEPSVFECRRTPLKTENSFKGSSDGSISSSSSANSTCSKSSSSSLQLSDCDKSAPKLPNKYQHKLKVKPGSSKKLAKVDVPKVDPDKVPPAVRDHIYANVVVLNNQQGKHGAAAPKEQPKAQASSAPSSSSLAKAGKSKQTSSNNLQPVPAPARLIISSPVATKVSFKENPCKRSICSPVSNEDSNSFWNFAASRSRSRSRERTPIDDSLVPGPTGSGEDSVGTKMKHSTSFPVTTSDKTNYGRSWYDGIETTKSMVVIPTTSTTVSDSARPPAARSLGFGTFLYDQRRDSSGSSVSNDSGWRSRSSYASNNKGSPALSRHSNKSDEIPEEPMDNKPPRPAPVIPADRVSTSSSEFEGKFTMLPSTSSDPDLDEPDVMAHKDLNNHATTKSRPTFLPVNTTYMDKKPISTSPAVHVVSMQPASSTNKPVIIKADVKPITAASKMVGNKCPVKVTYPITPQRYPLEDAMSSTTTNKQKKLPRPSLPATTSKVTTSAAAQVVPITTNSAAAARSTASATSGMSSFKPPEKQSAVGSSESQAPAAVSKFGPSKTPVITFNPKLTKLPSDQSACDADDVNVHKTAVKSSDKTGNYFTGTHSKARKETNGISSKKIVIQSSSLPPPPLPPSSAAAKLPPPSSSSAATSTAHPSPMTKSTAQPLATTSLLTSSLSKQGVSADTSKSISASTSVSSVLSSNVMANASSTPASSSTAPSSAASVVSSSAHVHKPTSLSPSAQPSTSSSFTAATVTSSSHPASVATSAVTSKPPLPATYTTGTGTTNATTSAAVPTADQEVANDAKSPRKLSTEDSVSVSNLSRKAFGKSTDSLASAVTAKSFDSMGSTGSGLSHRAEMTRYSKLSFLEASGQAPPATGSSIDQRFARFMKPANKTDTKAKATDIKAAPSVSATSGLTQIVPKGDTDTGPIQGRFINSMINQYRKSCESLTSPCSSVASSGLGSSVANSPTSPAKVSQEAHGFSDNKSQLNACPS